MFQPFHLPRRPVAIAAICALLAVLLSASPTSANPPPLVEIGDIQGAGHVSPLAGQLVTTTGVVTALAFNGYYLQDPDGDGDDETSDGIFVFTGGFPFVDVGHLLEVTDVPSEFIPGGAGSGNLSTTQLSFPATNVLSTGNPLPDPVIIGKGKNKPPAKVVISDDELPVNLQNVPGEFDQKKDGIDFYEALEGMRVTVDEPQLISATRTFSATSSEFFTVPARGLNVKPGNALTSRGGIELQPHPDNLGDQNPERVQIQFDPTLYPGTVPELAVGTILDDVTGVMGYSFGNFEVNATELVSVRTASPLGLETTSLVASGDDVSIASYNVLNLSGDGTDTGQMAVLAGHIVANLGTPDVLALQEIQDDSGQIDDGTVTADDTLQDLVDAIVAAGGPTYSFFDIDPDNNTQGGVPGGNIRNAYLYNSARVTLDGFERIEDAAFTGTRLPLVARFFTDELDFTVVNNHLTSRFGSSPIFGGPQPFVQAGEAAREAQVQALNDYVDGLLAMDDDANIVVVGDLNTFQWTNDIESILPGPERVLSNLIDSLKDDAVYTFIFDGNSQVLDHALVSPALKKSAEVDIVHVNIDFPRVSDDFGSDHEPLVIMLSD